MRRYLVPIVVLSVLFSCSSVQEQSADWRIKAKNADFAHRSVKQVTDVIVHDIFSPPVASRIYAYMSIAAYEAAIAQDPRFMSLAGQVKDLKELPKPEEGQEYCFQLASVQAALKVGRTLIFSEDKIDEFYNKIMQTFRDCGMPEEIYDRSIAYGTQVADSILAWSSKDNYKQSRSFPKYSIEDNPATWKPPPPAYMDAVEPHWAKIRTFAIDSCAQFKPAGPTAFSTNENSPFFKEAYEVYTIGKNL